MCLLAVSPALAQTTPPTETVAQTQMSTGTAPQTQTPTTVARKTVRQPFELDFGATWTGSIGLGSSSGNETQPDGTPLALFSGTSQVQSGWGVHADISHHLFGPIAVVVSGSWSRATFATTLTADFENAPLITATNGADQYTFEGGAIWQPRHHRRVDPFVRGTGGWMRQVTDDRSLLGDGYIVSAGGGVKYWWKDHGRIVPLGVRLEVEAIGRSGGLPVGPRRLRVAPGVSASLILHF